MKLIWNGHSCFTVETAQGTLVLDPYADGYVPGLGALKLKADRVLCSHGHRDHGAAEVVGSTGKTCAAKVDEIATFHDEVQGAKRGPNVIHIISAEGMRLVHCGDLGCELEPEQLEQLKGADVLLVPVGGFYTIDAAQARSLADAVGARIVVPMHYRGENFGYDVIGTVDQYLALCGDVVRYDSNVLDVTADTPAQTAVLTCPVE